MTQVLTAAVALALGTAESKVVAHLQLSRRLDSFSDVIYHGNEDITKILT